MSLIFENQLCVFSGEKLKFKIIHENELEFCLFQIIGEIFAKNVAIAPFNLKGVGSYYYHSSNTFYSSKPYMTDYTNCKVSIVMPNKLIPSYTQGTSFKVIYKLVLFFIYPNDQVKQLQAPFIYFPTESNNVEEFDLQRPMFFQTLTYSVQGVDSLLSPTSPRKLVQMIDALRNPEEFDLIADQIGQDVFLDEIEQQVVSSDSVFFYINHENARICQINLFKSAAILGRPIVGSIIALNDYCSNIQVSIETDETVDQKTITKQWNTELFSGFNHVKTVFSVHVPPQASCGFACKQLSLKWFLKVSVDIPVELSLGMEDEKSNDLIAVFTPHKRVVKSLQGRIPINIYPSKLHSLCVSKLYQMSQKL